MQIKIKNKLHDVKFTYNSFKLLKDFDMGALQDIERKPFLLFDAVEELLFGGLNHDPKKQIHRTLVAKFVEEYLDGEENDIGELFADVMKELEESNFFKKLQRTE